MTIKTKIYTLVKAVIGSETLVFADQNSPRPVLPYWTIRISTVRQIGIDSRSQGADVNGAQKISGVREITVQVQRYGTDSDIKCTDLQDNLARITVTDLWQQEKVSLYNVGDVLNVPYKMDDSHLEPRASIDLFVRFGTELLDTVGWVDTLGINAGYVTNQEAGFNNPNLDLAEVIPANM